MDATYSKQHHEWQVRKNEYDYNENTKKQLEDKKILIQHNEQMALLSRALAGDPEFINQAAEHVLQVVSLPVEFSIDFQYAANQKILYVDLDLHEIEHLPIKKATISSSGKLSIKEKSQKDIHYDYAQCVMGLAFFFAAQFFNISPAINQIVMSGYTQRLSKKTGNIENEYIYSVQFNRDTFLKLNFEKINPIDAFTNFQNRLLLSKTFDF